MRGIQAAKCAENRRVLMADYRWADYREIFLSSSTAARLKFAAPGQMPTSKSSVATALPSDPKDFISTLSGCWAIRKVSIPDGDIGVLRPTNASAT